MPDDFAILKEQNSSLLGRVNDLQQQLEQRWYRFRCAGIALSIVYLVDRSDTQGQSGRVTQPSR